MAQTKIKLIADGVIDVNNLAAGHTITTDNIGEGSNLYYTDARVSNYLTTNSYATESFVTSGYLPLSGGTLTGNISTSGTITANAFVGDGSGITGVSTDYTVQEISTNTNAVSGVLYVLTANLTLTLPASPSVGDKVAVSNMSNTITPVVARNGSLILGLAEDFTIDVKNVTIEFVYSGATEGWIMLADATYGTQPAVTLNGTGTTNYIAKWSATDTLADSVIYDNGTNIGIGTSSPSAKLDVIGTGKFESSSFPLDLIANTNNYGIKLTSVQAPSLLLYSTFDNADNRNWGIYTNSAVFGDFDIRQSIAKDGDITVGGNGISRLYIKNDGNIGIGTTSPSAKLHINSSSQDFVRLQGSSHSLYLYQDVGGLGWFTGANLTGSGAYYGQTNSTIQWFTGGSERMRITSAGNVGIGTTSPAYNLQVEGVNPVIRLKSAAAGFGFLIDQNNTTSDVSMISYDSAILRFGTAATERMRIDASGYVGIGTNAPASYNSYADNLVVADAAHSGISIVSGTTSLGTLMFADGTGGTAGYRGRVQYDHNTDSMNFHTSAAERMRITSGGDVLIGTQTDPFVTNNGGSGFFVASNGRMIERIATTTTAAATLTNYINPNGIVGSISVTGSSTAYNTSSDYRLKENVVEMTGALDRVDALKPSRFNFIADPEKTVDGFLAHEVAEVVPEAITGEKDAVDEDGNPIYQGIDQSKLVPLLVGAIKELKARIEILENK